MTDALAVKRRRLSSGVQSGGTGGAGVAGGAESRKRKWGKQKSSSSNGSTTTPAISTDILKVSPLVQSQWLECLTLFKVNNFNIIDLFIV